MLLCVGVAGAPGGASLTNEDFPALPTLSRNQRRKQRERDRNTAASLAERLAAASAPIRVVNRAVPGGSSTNTAAASSSSGNGLGLVRHSSSAGNLPAAAAAAASVADEESDDDPSGVDDVAGAGQAEDFPALPGGAATTQAHPAWVPVRRSTKPPRHGQQQRGNSGSSGAAGAPSISEFPSLAATVPASSRQAAGKSAVISSSRSRPGAASSSSSSGKQSVAAAVAAAGGVSEQLKAANKALIERCKAALSEEGFQDFREQSAAFMQGAMSAGGAPVAAVVFSI